MQEVSDFVRKPWTRTTNQTTTTNPKPKPSTNNKNSPLKKQKQSNKQQNSSSKKQNTNQTRQITSWQWLCAVWDHIWSPGHLCVWFAKGMMMCSRRCDRVCSYNDSQQPPLVVLHWLWGVTGCLETSVMPRIISHVVGDTVVLVMSVCTGCNMRVKPSRSRGKPKMGSTKSRWDITRKT